MYNLDAQGNPIPSWIPQGSTIVSKSGDNVSFRTPDGATQSVAGPSVQSAFESAQQAFESGAAASGVTTSPSGGTDPYTYEAPATPTGYSGPAAGRTTDGTNIGGEPGTGEFASYSAANLEKSEAFKALSEEDQAGVRAVFDAIASNDQKKAAKLIGAFEAAAKINDPFYAQQFRIAADTVKRGFVELENDLQYKEQLQQNRLKDLQKDIATRSEFQTLEEQNALKGIERQYEQEIKNTRQNMAARGMSFSSRRADTEELITEATGDVRESTKRKFGIQKLETERTLDRGRRDIAQETERIRQLAQEGKLDLFRSAEETLGTQNLPNLSGTPDPLGNITGAIPQEKLQNTLTSAQSFVF